MQRYLQMLLLGVLAPCCIYCSEPIINIHLLTGTKVRNNTVVPVVISLKTDRLLEGEFVVSSNGTNSHNYRIPVSVGQGTFRYEVPYFLSTTDGDSIELYVTFRGNVKDGVMSSRYPLESLDMTNRDELVIGWVSQGGTPPDVLWFGKKGEVDFKLATKENVINSEFDRDDKRWGDEYSLRMKRCLVHFSNMPAQMLPRDFRMLDAFDALYISTESVRKISPDDASVIVKWVSQGGRLILEESAFSTAYAGYPLRAKLPVIEHAEGVAVIQVPVGLGAVARVGIKMDPAADNFKDVTVEFCRSLVTNAILPLGQDHLFSRYNYGWGGEPSDLMSVPLWGNIMHRWVQLESVSKWSVIGLLIVFVILVTVVDRLVLKRYKRLYLTWGTTSAVVIVFCLMVNYISVITRGTRPRQTTMRIVDVGMDGASRLSQLTCFIPSRSTRYTFAVGERGQVRNYRYSKERSNTYIGGTSFNAISIAPSVWSSAFISTVEPMELHKPFSADLTASGNGFMGSVEPTQEGTRYLATIVLFQGNTYTIEAGEVSKRPIHSFNPMFTAINAAEFSISPDFTESRYFYYDQNPPQKNFEELMKAVIDPALSGAAPNVYPRPPCITSNTAWILALALDPETSGVAGSKLKSLRLVRQQVPVKEILDTQEPLPDINK